MASRREQPGRERGEFLQSLSVASGSLAEAETQLIIANRLEMLPPERLEALLRQSEEISKGIHLSRNAVQADRRGISLGAPASCRLLTGVDALRPARTPALPGSDCPTLSG